MPRNGQTFAQAAWSWLLAKDVEKVHWRRYLLGAVSTSLGFAALSAVYMLLPKTYTSEWSVILPGAGSENRLSIESIGQAQSSASSPFSDKALSPKVNYKEIAESRPVITAAAKELGLSYEEFGKPRIKLVDQASIILFQVKAPSPAEAQRRSRALFNALRERLNELRKDEVESKNNSLRESIADVEQGVNRARTKLLQLQTDSGLASIEQFNQLVSSIETLRRDQAAARATVAEKRMELESIRGELGIGPKQAADLLRLSADPETRLLTQSYATTSSAYAEISTSLGAAHPRLIDTQGKLASVRSALRSKLQQTDVGNTPLAVELPLDSDRIQSLLADLVEKSAALAGHEAKLNEIDRIMLDAEERRTRLGVVAAHLDDLQRDHLIANAVFSSALARLDASKSDHYASYPLVQMLSEPTLPEVPSSPRLLFAVLAAVLGTILSCMGWFFCWLHQWFIFDRLRRKLALA